MKKIGFIYLFITLLSVGFVACTEEDFAGKVKETSFTEVEGVDVTLLDSMEYVIGSFKFDTPEKWTVTSDQMMWVSFSDAVDGEFYADISGAAGENIVYVKVSDAGRGYSADSAKITLTSGNKEYVVSTITRPGKKWLDVKAKDGSVVDAIEIDESANAWYLLEGLFECAPTSYPSWLQEPVFEDGGYRFSIIDSLDLLQNPLEGELIVSDRTNTYQSYVPVRYSGMNPAVIRISGDTPWNWLASIDGKKIKSKQAMDSVVIKESLEMDVFCRNNAYSIVFAEEKDSLLYPKAADDAWIKATRNGNKVSVTVDASETGAPRSGYLFAVPDVLRDSLDIALSMLDSAKNILDKYESCVLVQMEQRAAGFDVFLVEDDVETAVPCEIDEQADWFVIVASNYFNGTDPDVSACNVELGKSYVINTKLTADNWSPGDMALCDIDYESIRLSSWIPKKYKQKAVLGEDGFYRIYIEVPENLVIDEETDPNKKYNNNIVLRLLSPDGLNMKALVVRVQE